MTEDRLKELIPEIKKDPSIGYHKSLYLDAEVKKQTEQLRKAMMCLIKRVKHYESLPYNMVRGDIYDDIEIIEQITGISYEEVANG